MSDAVQLSVPCWFEALQVYSLLSALTGLTSSKHELVWRLRILYLSLCLISIPDLYHLKVTFGASSVSHSNLALLPTLISRGSIFCLNTGGAEARRENERTELEVSHEIPSSFVRNDDRSRKEMVECTTMVEGNSGVTVKKKNSKNISPTVQLPGGRC